MRELRATTVTWKLLVLAAAAAAVMALASPSQLPVAGQAPPVGLQANCTTICGDVIVPYPFGITAGCYLPSYNLTCDTRHTPPRLFLGNGVLQVVGISLENSTVRVVGPNIPMDPYTANGTWGGHGWGLSDDGPYFLSEEYNELVLVGCQLSAELSVILDWDYQVINTCGSFCGEGINFNKECQAPAKKQSRRCQRCSGIGCCQVPVSIGRSSYKVRLQSLMTPGAVNMPNSVFISEEGWFQEPYDHSNMTSSGIPAILAWVIVSEVVPYVSDPRDGNTTCPKNLGRTSCHSSYSTCRNTDSRYDNNYSYISGYTCSCWDGYEGNPYIPHGCQGISLSPSRSELYGSILFALNFTS
nr:unnamed protein product [Digitaria exilis]